MAQLEQVYAAVSANRIENGVSIKNNRLLYSRSHSPVIYDLKDRQVISQFIGHTDEVNGQCFVQSINEEESGRYIVSTSYDKTAIIWDIDQNKGIFTIESPEDHEFTTRCAIKRKNGEFITIASTIFGNIYVFNNNQLKSTVKTNLCYLDAKLHVIPETETVILLLAGGDNKVHIHQLLPTDSLVHILDLSGHGDWVKCLQILDIRKNELLLASASQDSFVRVWHLKLVTGDINLEQIRTIASKTLEGENCNSRLTATLETVLIGHEGMVHGLCWFRKEPESKLKLVTCSADKTLIIWTSSIANPTGQQTQKYEQCPASAEVWKDIQHLGETGETNLPFLSVCLSEDERTIYSNSLRGAIHSWVYSDQEKSWLPGETIMGHYEPVSDLSWEKSGAYLISCSLDKTVRLHSTSRVDNRWHELARPQVHGHEINCIASINFSNFATGAEEKTIRTFEATQFFLKNYKELASKIPQDLNNLIETLPAHAQLPALGLSNRGAKCPYDLEESGDKTAVGSASNAWYGVSSLVTKLAEIDHLDKIPFEEILLQSTLWWETNKLYGHGNELYALAACSSAKFLASASKANRLDLAIIIIWECTKYRKVATIEHHSLTITRLKFSPDDKYLLSVSRDRTWCLSESTGQVKSAYKKLIGSTKNNSQHERIIWDCCWTFDSKYFMTVSRDKKAILWSVEDLIANETISSKSLREFDHSIQAVDSINRFVNVSNSQQYLFAFGLEGGSLELCSYCAESNDWYHLRSIAKFHQLSIRRLAFQPREDSIIMLASAGDDCVVKLTRINMRDDN